MPVLGDEAERQKLLDGLNLALGTELERTQGWPPIRTTVLAEEGRLAAFLNLMDDIAKRAVAVSESDSDFIG